MENENNPSRLSDPKEFIKAFDLMITKLEINFGHKIKINEKKVDTLEKTTIYGVKIIKQTQQ